MCTEDKALAEALASDSRNQAGYRLAFQVIDYVPVQRKNVRQPYNNLKKKVKII